MNKIPINIIVEGKVLIVKNLYPAIFSSNIADGVYLIDNGESVTITPTENTYLYVGGD